MSHSGVSASVHAQAVMAGIAAMQQAAALILPGPSATRPFKMEAVGLSSLLARTRTTAHASAGACTERGCSFFCARLHCVVPTIPALTLAFNTPAAARRFATSSASTEMLPAAHRPATHRVPAEGAQAEGHHQRPVDRRGGPARARAGGRARHQEVESDRRASAGTTWQAVP